MADININKFRTSVVREGSRPASPGFVESEGQDPVDPAGSTQNHLPVTIAPAADGLSITDSQVLGGAGTTAQYLRGDGSLASFPSLTGYVPYTGATQNVDLGEFGLDTGFVNLDTTPTNTPTTQGTMYWDDSRSTAALIMNGTLQHIGQDTFFYVKNASGSSIAKGTAVRFDGTDGASGHLLIAPFLANGTYPSNYFMGVTAETIANGGFGQVMHFGELSGINTSGYTAGALLYASTTVAGGFQTTAPVAPNNIVLIAAAINSKNNGEILVRPTYGSNINQDEGVKIVSPTTGQLLQLQSNGLWENKTKAQVLGGTSSQFVKADGSLDSTIYVSGSGTSGQIAYFNGTSSITGESSLFWDATNDRLGIGTATINHRLQVAPLATFGNAEDGNICISTTPSGGTSTSPTTTGGIIFGDNTVANSYLGRIAVIQDNPSASTASHMRFYTNSGGGNGATTERLRITAAGRVLIGTPPPAESTFTLDVNGTGRFSSSLTTGADLTLSAANPFVYGGTAAGSVGLSNIGGQTYVRVFGASHATTPNVTQFVNAGSTSLTIASTGAATFSGSVSTPHTTKTANYTLTETDYTVGFDCASNRTATLPDATTCAGRIYVIYQYNTNLGARSVTLDGNGSQTINGLTTYNLLGYCDYSSVMIQSNGSNWIIIANALETCPV